MTRIQHPVSDGWSSVFFCTRVTILLACLWTLCMVPVSAQTKEDCLGCHEDTGLTMERSGKVLSLYVRDSVLRASPHRGLVCVACHTGFDKDNIPHKDPLLPVNCLSCHRDAPLKHPFHPRLLKSTANDVAPDISCKGCHGTHDVTSPTAPSSRWNGGTAVTSCGACHMGVKNEYQNSAHGLALRSRVSSAPTCLSCHRSPITGGLRSPAAAEPKLAQARMCLTCHLDEPGVRASMPKGAGVVSPWMQSPHGAALQRGNGQAASCADCHGSHTVNDASHPKSPVHRANLSVTCGKCHTDISTQYRHGIHGRLTEAGRKDTPGCEDCHAEHPNVAQAKHPGGPASMATPALSCGSCHPPAKVLIRTAVDPGFFSAKNPGYHGFQRLRDSLTVTRCASCHGAHDIREKSDSASAVHPANIATTCGACHPDASVRFAGHTIHSPTALRKDAASSAFPLKLLYQVLIALFLVWRIGLSFIRRRSKVRHAVPSHDRGDQRVRMAVLVAFVFVAVSGFAIRYPGTLGIAQVLYLIPSLSGALGWLHHLASAIFIVLTVWYLARLVAARHTTRDLPVGDWILFWILLLGVVVLVVTGVVTVLVDRHSSLGMCMRDLHAYQGWFNTVCAFFSGRMMRRRAENV